jgi:hydroxypyruvate isomerase
VRTHGLRFDVNCSILFTELPLLKRPGAARAAGFGAVEFWWPFTDPVPADREVDAFTGALADAGVQLALLNFAGGDMAAGATVVVEALNSYDSPRAALVSSQRALEVINLVRAQAGVANVAFLADLYHLGKMGEDLPGTLAREAASIAHVQIADVPDRGAPGTGQLDCEALFGQLARQGYAGWIGCEYKPADPTDSSTSFGWREPDEE